MLEYGSEDEYVMGENDFPVTPAHTPLGFGADFAYSFTKNIAIALEARYILSSEVALIDPSDQDTVEINTSSHRRRNTGFASFLSNTYRTINSD